MACRVLITAAAAAHSPWVVRSANGNNGQRHRAAATPATGGGGNDNGQRQQAAATPATGSGNNGSGQRQLWQRAAATGAVLLEIINSLKF